VQATTRENDGIVDAYRYFEEVLTKLRAADYDMCINMASSAYTAMLLRLLNVTDNRGWVSDDEGFRLISNPWAMLFAAFVYHSNRDFNSINLVDILRCSAGVGEHPRTLVYNVPADSKDFAERFFAAKNIDLANAPGPIIAVQAGASQEKRQWSPARFGFLARTLIENLGATVVLTGSKSESRISDAIVAHYSHPRLVSAVGETGLGDLAALVKRADLLVTGDTGTMHLAVAVGTPVVALFLASALCFETGPYGEGNLVLQPQIHCNPCNPNLPCSRPDCHDQIPPDLVAKLVEIRLNTPADQLPSLTISREIADPAQIAVYVTTFDTEGFLDFKPLNGGANRKGFGSNYYQAIRESYRTVWKSEFGAELGLARRGTPTVPAVPKGEIERALEQIVNLCGEGQKHLEILERYILDPQVPAKLLGEANIEVTRTDRALENIGLSQGPVGALVRMFIMERENLRGEDPVLLARATKGLYDDLARRSRLFWEQYRLSSAENY